MGRFVNGHPPPVLAAAWPAVHGSPHATSLGMSEVTLLPISRDVAALPSTHVAHPTVVFNSPIAHSECDVFMSPTTISYVSCKFSKEQIIAFGGISEGSILGAQSSGRLRAQPNANATHLERAMLLAQGRDDPPA
jgi:hypothetical protein